MLTHGRCERVARERAGGERDIHFAGQNECRVPPSTKAASEVPAATMRRVLNAGRRELKGASANKLVSLRKRQKESGESEGLFPGGARFARPGCGAGRGGAAP